MTVEYSGTYHSLLQHVTLTEVTNNDHDLSILRYMFLCAKDAADRLDTDVAPREPIVIHMKDIPGGLRLRIVTKTRVSLQLSNLSFVGFISKKQCSVTPDIQNRVDAADSGMLLELAKQPALLSYVSLQLSDENWYNLVIFSHDGAKHAILTTSLHHYAAYELAPHYYQWIRLHHGSIEQRDTALELMLHTTKYYTFPTSAASPVMYVQEHQPVHAIAHVVTL